MYNARLLIYGQLWTAYGTYRVGRDVGCVV